jgi:hypothetical protein
MRKRFSTMLAAAAVAGAFAMSTAANAACVSKAGQGTGSTPDAAKFQAWEAVLQATDWGSWASFMAGGMKIGSAPGYKVSGLRSSCKPGGGLGYTCTMGARLCN